MVMFNNYYFIEYMIEIKNLEVGVEEKQILKKVSLQFELWKNYCLLGKNGSGKSTLSSFLMGHPKYECISWEVSIDGENLLEKRSRREKCSRAILIISTCAWNKRN